MYGEDSGIRRANWGGIWSRWGVLCFKLYNRVIEECWEGFLSESTILKVWNKRIPIILKKIEA